VTKQTVGFVGLGGMGLAMATNLLEAGYNLRVYNRTAEKGRPLLQRGATLAYSPDETALPGGIVVTMVSDDAAVEEVALGAHGFLDRLGSGVHLSMSTIAPRTATRLADASRRRGGRYVASPVFGKPDVAARAGLWIATSGDPAARARVWPIQEALSRKVFDFGEDPSAAHVVKLAGNFLLGAAIEAMAEAFTLAQKHGVPRRLVQDFFARTLFDCSVYRGYGELIASEHYQPVGARPSLIRKDFGLILQAADEGLVPMPLAALIHERLTATVARGRDDDDWAGFARETSESAGL
jgi:3-hydroxyisobutyrate dehydrogenase-like beta-hydroxyacid dehydrogenase